MAGAVSGCGKPEPSVTPDASTTGADASGDEATAVAQHLCRGLNACKGQGQGGENDCAGQGNCATVALHTCGGQNECKGLGGCGSHPGENDCKGEGHCAVPLMQPAWEQLRAKFETQMGADGKEFGPAPAPQS